MCDNERVEIEAAAAQKLEAEMLKLGDQICLADMRLRQNLLFNVNQSLLEVYASIVLRQKLLVGFSLNLSLYWKYILFFSPAWGSSKWKPEGMGNVCNFSRLRGRGLAQMVKDFEVSDVSLPP